MQSRFKSNKLPKVNLGFLARAHNTRKKNLDDSSGSRTCGVLIVPDGVRDVVVGNSFSPHCGAMRAGVIIPTKNLHLGEMKHVG